MRNIELDSETISAARAGDADALVAIVRALERPFHGLARRMMRDAADAEDAAQEALLRVVTHLDQFQGAARFSTWAFRIAINRILDFRSKHERLPLLTFDAIDAEIHAGLEPEAPERPDDAIFLEEIKIQCGIAMLHTLDAEHRLAYILVEIFDLSGEEAAEILEIEPATFRKRLSRARERVQGVLRSHCGIVEPQNPCRCHRRLSRARALGRIRENARGPASIDLPRLRAAIAGLEDLQRAAAFYRADPMLAARRDLVEAVRFQLESAATSRQS